MSEYSTNGEVLPAQAVREKSIVRLHFIDEPGDPEETFYVLNQNTKADSEITFTKLYTDSPVGQAILGAKPEDIREFKIPGNIISRVRIISVI